MRITRVKSGVLMSRFYHAVPLLAKLTGKPLFAKMLAEDKPLPMSRDVRQFIKSAEVKPRQRYLIGRAVRALSRSRRYMECQLEDGAMRHDLDGNPIEPVTESQRKFIRSEQVRVAAIVAAKTSAQRPILSLKRGAA